jgi:hypothetical protein
MVLDCQANHIHDLASRMAAKYRSTQDQAGIFGYYQLYSLFVGARQFAWVMINTLEG